MIRIVPTALIGLGNVGRNFLYILETKADRLRAQFNLELRIVCVADSSGVAVDAAGFLPSEVRQIKENGGSVASLAGYVPGRSTAEVLADLTCELVLEASPVNLVDGEPGLGIVRAALQRGINVVLANKGPLVLAFGELQRLAAAHGAALAYSATVCGALPVINIGQRDLIAAEITLLRGIFNSTSNFILDEMSQGRSYDAALTEAQRRGIAEADPSLDVEGWDTANKLVIIANSILGVEIALADLSVEGITNITTEKLQQALAQNRTIKLVATAQAVSEGYEFLVAPVALSAGDFLAGCSGWEMGVEIQSDLYGKMYHKIWEREPLPTAAAMLRDAVNLFSPA